MRGGQRLRLPPRSGAVGKAEVSEVRRGEEGLFVERARDPSARRVYSTTGAAEADRYCEEAVGVGGEKAASCAACANSAGASRGRAASTAATYATAR